MSSKDWNPFLKAIAGIKTSEPLLRSLLPTTSADVLPHRRHEIADEVMAFHKMIGDYSMGWIIVLNFKATT